MSTAKGGRKTKEEKLQLLKVKAAQLQEQKDCICEELKSVNQQITELEQFFLLQEAAKIKEAAANAGVSIDEVVQLIKKTSTKND